MTDPTVVSAMKSTMLMTPTIAAPPNTMPDEIGALDPAPLIVVTVLLTFATTPEASNTPKRMPTTISHTKNSAIDRTQENFSTVHGLMWRSCRRARRGPRTRGGFEADFEPSGPGGGVAPARLGALSAGAAPPFALGVPDTVVAPN